jgi:DnaJ-domain-containing protein 1
MNYEEIIGHVAGRVAQGLRHNDPIVSRYAAALRKLAEHALTKWAAASAAGLRCGVVLRKKLTGVRECCGELAAGSCVVCSKATCIDHSLVSVRDGRIICDGCVMAVASSYVKQPPPNPGFVDTEALLERHLRTLGLQPGASRENVKARFKELGKKHHPDRKTGVNKERAERLMKEFTEAYSWLMRQYENEAAA